MNINSFKYDENEDYYMLSVHRENGTRHAREQFMTTDEIYHQLNKLLSHEDYIDLEIFNERTLDIRGNFELIDGTTEQMTIREALFDYRFQRFADQVRTGMLNSDKQ